ncbi:hypothetical protein RRF57_007124 [Xylaria bambusicola]|uniref:Uncharacterized protein n=1 Tax=Xylaria bambusicola TaxID=326684 RepID=A0AAN7UFQ0_9PEZI
MASTVIPMSEYVIISALAAAALTDRFVAGHSGTFRLSQAKNHWLSNDEPMPSKSCPGRVIFAG